MRRLLFLTYSWSTNILFMFLEVMPSFVRGVCFKLLFKEYGRDNMIDYGCYFRYPRKIRIGSRVSINRGCAFYPSFHVEEAEIRIGDNVAIGPEVTFFSAGHDHKTFDLDDVARSIVIGDWVWIGGRSTILPGVVVGEGAVVGAGSVVREPVAPYTIVAGNPAVWIKDRKVTDRDGRAATMPQPPGRT